MAETTPGGRKKSLRERMREAADAAKSALRRGQDAAQAPQPSTPPAAEAATPAPSTETAPAALEDILSQLQDEPKAAPVPDGPKTETPQAESVPPQSEAEAPASLTPPAEPATPPAALAERERRERRGGGILSRFRRGQPEQPTAPDPRGVRRIGPRFKTEQPPPSAVEVDQSAAAQLERMGIRQRFYDRLKPELALALASYAMTHHDELRDYMKELQQWVANLSEIGPDRWKEVNTPLPPNASAAQRQAKNINLAETALSLPYLIMKNQNAVHRPPKEQEVTMDDALKDILEALQRITPPPKKK